MEIRLLVTIALIVAGIATSFSLASQTMADGVVTKGCDDTELGLTGYDDNRYNFSFCYPKSFGEVSIHETGISPEARNGTAYYLKFSNSVNNEPLMVFLTQDFKKLGDSDVPSVISWKGLNMNDSLDQIKSLLPADENPVLEKVIINDKTILKVRVDYIEPFEGANIKATKYFIPNVKFNDDDYNLYILCSPDMEQDVQAMIENMN